MVWRGEKWLCSGDLKSAFLPQSGNTVDKLGARLNVGVCFDKDVLQLECDRKRAKYQTKH
jgi:hypothetical protein